MNLPALLLCLLGSALDLAPQVATAGDDPAVVAAPASKDWIAKSGDSICGLKEPSQVSNPVVVDWQACLDATPEMKKAKAEKIDLSTPEGIKLVNEATNRVTEACESIRAANGYCSVWKAIKHKDGRAITDISDLVKAQY
jgi:hypothetical protein